MTDPAEPDAGDDIFKRAARALHRPPSHEHKNLVGELITRLATVQAAHRGAEAEAKALRDWKDLHSADVRSIRSEMEEVEQQYDHAYTELTAVRSALMLLTAFTAGKAVAVDE